MADRQDLLIPQQGKKQPRPLTSSPSLEDSRQAGKQHYCNILPTDISTQIEQPYLQNHPFQVPVIFGPRL